MDEHGTLIERLRNDDDLRSRIEAADKIEGLEADLASAVTVAWDHGAQDWVRANYPAAAAAFTLHPPE